MRICSVINLGKDEKAVFLDLNPLLHYVVVEGKVVVGDVYFFDNFEAFFLIKLSRRIVAVYIQFEDGEPSVSGNLFHVV